MRRLKDHTAVIALTLALTPVLAAGQASDSVAAALNSRLPLERYAASLGIATPAGSLLKRTEPSRRPWGWRSETRADGSRSAPAADADESSAASPECPMPVIRPDTAVRRDMPAGRVPTAPAPAGLLHGCVNPLAASR